MAARRKARREAKRQSTGSMPGMGNMSNKQMKQAMNQMNVQDIENVQEVLIRTDKEEIVLTEVEVQIMNMSGQEIYTITAGASESRGLTTSSSPSNILEEDDSDIEVEIKENDVNLIMKQTGKDRETVVNALKSNKGDLASTILALK
jgi:alpha-NAC-related protein